MNKIYGCLDYNNNKGPHLYFVSSFYDCASFPVDRKLPVSWVKVGSDFTLISVHCLSTFSSRLRYPIGEYPGFRVQLSCSAPVVYLYSIIRLNLASDVQFCSVCFQVAQSFLIVLYFKLELLGWDEIHVVFVFQHLIVAC